MSNFLLLDRVGGGYEFRDTGRADKLMYVHKVTLTAAASATTGVSWTEYTAAILGYEADAVVQDMFMARDTTTGNWYVVCTSITGFVHVLFIHRSLCKDATATTITT